MKTGRKSRKLGKQREVTFPKNKRNEELIMNVIGTDWLNEVGDGIARKLIGNFKKIVKENNTRTQRREKHLGCQSIFPNVKVTRWNRTTVSENWIFGIGKRKIKSKTKKVGFEKFPKMKK